MIKKALILKQILLSHKKDGQGIWNVWCIEIKELKFRHYKNLVFIGDVCIDNILISNKVYICVQGVKHFIHYRDDDFSIKPFCLILPEASAYLENYDGETK